MKQKHILITVLFTVAINDIIAQRVIITNDSLLVHFQQEEPIEVYDYYQRRFDDALDYKSLYYDQEMKDYLLKWLDKGVGIDNKINDFKRYLQDFSEEQNNALTKDYIIRVCKLNYDSICPNPVLLNFYYNEAILRDIENYKDDLLRNQEKILPPEDALYLHARIVYPESYKIIKNIWYRHNKPVTFNDVIFSCLLMMNDTETQSIFDKIITDVVKSGGETANYSAYSLFIFLNRANNAYYIKKLVELLDVHKSYQYISGGAPKPLDDLIYGTLKDLFRYHKIETTAYAISYKTPEDYIQQMRKRKPLVIEAAERLIKQLKAEEQYWMVNMPFDYIPTVNE
ncbi:hypothetical protein [Viscerimonas tarda]